MKKVVLFTTVLAFGAFTFTSCSEDETLPEPQFENAADPTDDKDDDDDQERY